MKALSLYCGAGGIDEGLKQVGVKTICAIDSWSDACRTFELNHPDTQMICGKVIDCLDILPEADIIVGGPPCPEFSNANTSRTYDPTEVNLFWQIVDKVKPKFWLMENVINVIKVCKREPNYVLDCSYYGVPQSRQRRFFTNIPKPLPQKQIGLDSIIKIDGFTSNSGFKKCNQYLISRKSNEPCKTLQIASTLRVTDKPVYSTKYPNLPQDYKVTHIFSNDELKLIQGFPKDYKFYGNKQSVKAQICNAVPPPVIKSISQQIFPLEVLVQ